MKRILIILLVPLIFLNCSKDDESNKIPKVNIPIGTITAEIDGIQTTFDIQPKAVIDTIFWSFGQEAVKLSISAKKSNDINSENILIWFFVTPVREIDKGKYPDLNKQIYHYLEFNNIWRNDLYNYG